MANPRKHRPDPAAVTAAVIPGLVGATIATVRGTGLWPASLIGFAIAASVLIVIVLVGRPERASRAAATNVAAEVPAGALAEPAALLQRSCQAVGTILVRAAVTAGEPERFPDADKVVHLARSVLDGIYRTACLLAKAPRPEPPGSTITNARRAMVLGVQRLDALAREVPTESDAALQQLMDDLESAQKFLDRTATELSATLERK